MLLQKGGTACLIEACLCGTLLDNGSGLADVLWRGGGELNDTHKATENNTAEIIGEGKSMCVCVCVCLGRDKNQGTHKSISYTHSVI